VVVVKKTGVFFFIKKKRRPFFIKLFREQNKNTCMLLKNLIFLDKNCVFVTIPFLFFFSLF